MKKLHQLDLETLEYIKLSFDIHSDMSSRCNGYHSLCRIIEEIKKFKTRKDGKLQVLVSEILSIETRKREINHVELTEIDFLDDDGNVISMDKKIIEDFRFTGLINTDFITTEFYKEGFKEEKI